MKKMMIAITLMYCFNVLGASSFRDKELEGSAKPEDALKGFLLPLKEGINGLSESVKSTNNVMNSDTYKYANQQLEKQGSSGKTELNRSDIISTLREDMSDGGKLINVKMIEKDDSKLNGAVQKYTYNLTFSNGKSRQLQFKLIRPTMNGGFFITEISPE